MSRQSFPPTGRRQSPNNNPKPGDWDNLDGTPPSPLPWFLVITLIVSVTLASGVYWLRHLPAGSDVSQTGTVVQVRLIDAQEQIKQHQLHSPDPQKNGVETKSEPLVQDPHRVIPKSEDASRQEQAPDDDDDDATSVAASAAPASAAKETSASAAASARTPSSPTALRFQQKLLSHIARYRLYPDEAKRERLEGTVQVVFSMHRDGEVTEISVRESSGSMLLDSAAVDTIRSAQPLPKIPPELPDHLNILLPIAFNLP